MFESLKANPKILLSVLIDEAEVASVIQVLKIACAKSVLSRIQHVVVTLT